MEVGNEPEVQEKVSVLAESRLIELTKLLLVLLVMEEEEEEYGCRRTVGGGSCSSYEQLKCSPELLLQVLSL